MPQSLSNEYTNTNQHLSSAFRLLNERQTRRLIYQLTRRGFGSEINSLILGILFALTNNREIILHTSSWNGHIAEGWEDYFEPFCKNNSEERWKARTVIPKEIKGFGKKHLTAFRDFKNLILRYTAKEIQAKNVFIYLRSHAFFSQHFKIPELNIDGDILHAKRSLLELIYRPKESVAQEIRGLRQSISLGSEYIGLHIRRGDKITSREAKLIDIGSYIKEVHEAMKQIGDRTIFISTDDYSIVEEMRERAPKSWQILTLCTDEERGHAQTKFNKQDPEKRRADMIRILTDIEILTESIFFIGTYSSNLSRLIGLRKGLENCKSLDHAWHPL